MVKCQAFAIAIFSAFYLSFFSVSVFAAESNLRDQIWAIKGKAVTTSGIKSGWLVFSNGIIEAVGASKEDVPDAAVKIYWNQYIYPGLVDTHNHAKWNSIPQWTEGPFQNRYQWQESPSYLARVKGSYEALGFYGVKETSLKYAELRALIGGTTLLQGSYYELKPDFLCKNLDARYGVRNHVPNVVDMTVEKENELNRGLERGELKRVFFHLGEGLASDKMSRSEFGALEKKGFLRPGVVVIHGLAFDRKQFERMAKREMFLVWSPVSNWNLYRGIVDIKAALEAGLVVSLAPDWTVSGSDNVLEEMKFAYAIGKARWGNLISPRRLFEMVTIDAAKVAGVDRKSIGSGAPMGELAVGCAADLFLAPKLDSCPDRSDDPYESLLRTYPRHIHLVFVDGKPLYGDRSTLKELVGRVDNLVVQNSPKAVVPTVSSFALRQDLEHFEEVRQKLFNALPAVAPLIEN